MVALAIAGASAAGGIAKGIIGSGAASAAAKAQEAQAQNAALTEQKFYGGLIPYFEPYINAGTNILPQLTAYASGTPAALQSALDFQKSYFPQIPTEADVKNMPGYDFLLSQGLKATQNSAAARGLGVSGTAMKGAANYATGLADTYWKDLLAARTGQFNDAGNLFTNTYNMRNLGGNQLQGIASLGATAAGTLGGIGQKIYSDIGQQFTNYGTAAAGGIAGQAKALGGAVDSLASAPASYLGAENAIASNDYLNSVRQLNLARLQQMGGSGGYVDPNNS